MTTVAAPRVARALGRPVEHWNGPRLERVTYTAVLVLEDGTEVACQHEHGRRDVADCARSMAARMEQGGAA